MRNYSYCNKLYINKEWVLTGLSIAACVVSIPIPLVMALYTRYEFTALGALLMYMAMVIILSLCIVSYLLLPFNRRIITHQYRIYRVLSSESLMIYRSGLKKIYRSGRQRFVNWKDMIDIVYYHEEVELSGYKNRKRSGYRGWIETNEGTLLILPLYIPQPVEDAILANAPETAKNRWRLLQNKRRWGESIFLFSCLCSLLLVVILWFLIEERPLPVKVTVGLGVFALSLMLVPYFLAEEYWKKRIAKKVQKR